MNQIAKSPSADSSYGAEAIEFYGSRSFDIGCQLAYLQRPRSDLLASSREMAKFLIRLPLYSKRDEKEIAGYLLEQGARGYSAGVEWLECFKSALEPLFRDKTDADIIEREAEYYQRDIPDYVVTKILSEFNSIWPVG